MTSPLLYVVIMLVRVYKTSVKDGMEDPTAKKQLLQETSHHYSCFTNSRLFLFQCTGVIIIVVPTYTDFDISKTL